MLRMDIKQGILYCRKIQFYCATVSCCEEKNIFENRAQVYKADDEMARLEYDGDWSEGKKCGKGTIK
jgi:hypothetical protein